MKDLFKQTDWDLQTSRTQGGEFNAYDASVSALKQYAEKSVFHAQLASSILDDYTKQTKEIHGYVPVSERYQLNALSERLKIDLATQHGRVEGFKAIETYYFGEDCGETL